MSRIAAVSAPNPHLNFAADTRSSALNRFLSRTLAILLLGCSTPAFGIILWSDLGATLAHENGPGADILGGAVKRDDSSGDTLYFKFHVDPLSDATTEEYFAAFELFDGQTERLGVGNALTAWAYSAFVNTDESGDSNKVAGYIDLHSSKPEPLGPPAVSSYELPRRGTGRTIVFKVQFVPGGDDLVTVWLNPDLGPGANEVYQPESLTTRFNANAAFDEIRLRHAGAGDGWAFSDMAIATSFSDFVDTSSAKPGATTANARPGSPPFRFRIWQREQGMPHDAIRAMAQTRDGYLWLASDQSLARFDGVRFVPIDLPDSLRGIPVRALFGDSRGALWMGAGSAGLIRYLQGRFDQFTTHQGLPSDSVLSLAEDNEERLWIGTDAGLAILQDGRIQKLPGAGFLDGKPVTALFHDPAGSIWLGATGVGIYRFREHQFTKLQDSANEALLQDPHCLFYDNEQRLWVGAGDDSLLCQERGLWHRYRLPSHASRPFVKTLAQEPDGAIWAGSPTEGLFYFVGGKLTPLNAANGLSDDHVESLFVDDLGKLWIGAESGLNRLQHQHLRAFGQNEGLGYGAVQGIAEVAPGVIWAVKPKEGLYRWEGQTFSRLTAAGLPLHDPQVNAILVSRDGSCWVACGRGLLRYKDPQAVADEFMPAGLNDPDITALAEDAAGCIWAGTRDGNLWRLASGRWLAQSNSWGTHAITAIVPAAHDDLWIATDGSGLFRLNAATRAKFSTSDGLSSDSIRVLYLDAQRVLWIGTTGGGLCWLKGGRFARFTTREGLPDNTVSQILEDAAGRLWLGGNRGIACVNKRALENLAAGSVTTLYPPVYGLAEGMLSEECTSGFFPAALKNKAGLLWFSTTKGVVAIDASHFLTGESSPRVTLEEVLVDGEPVAQLPAGGALEEPNASSANSPGQLNIPPGRHRLELRYTGLGFDSPEQTRFRYRLEGLDTEWTDAGTRRIALYNYVPPGNYRFHVTACDSDGVWTDRGADLALKVARHFWQIGWVLALASLGLTVSAAGTVRIMEKRKLQRRLKRLEQERALERERTRIAQDLHDEMGAKLCRISFLSEHARRIDPLPSELQQQIASISDASREVLHSLDEIVWAVNPQNDSLEHLASYIGQYAQDYFQMTGIDCELDIPAELPQHPLSSQARHHLFLAVHEAFTNILKHSGATRACISVSCSPAGIEIVASDNGRGFVPPAAPSGEETNPAETGDGLRNMQRRLAAIGGRCEVQSQPGQGATIRFLIPLKPVSQEK